MSSTLSSVTPEWPAEILDTQLPELLTFSAVAQPPPQQLDEDLKVPPGPCRRRGVLVLRDSSRPDGLPVMSETQLSNELVAGVSHCGVCIAIWGGR